MEDVAARVQAIGPVEQPEPRLHRADPVVVERGGERADRAGTHDGVRVEEDDDVGAEPLDAPVAAGAEAEVLARLDEHDAVAVERERAAVVHDDELVGLARQRVQAPRQVVAAVVRDDDDADAQ